MTDFAEKARQALAAREADDKARKEAVQSRAEAAALKQQQEQALFDRVAMPILSAAATQLSAGGIEAKLLDRPSIHMVSKDRVLQRLQVGHNNAGQTLVRVATVTVVIRDDKWFISTESHNGKDQKWTAPVEQVPEVIGLAIDDAIARWCETGDYERASRR